MTTERADELIHHLSTEEGRTALLTTLQRGKGEAYGYRTSGWRIVVTIDSDNTLDTRLLSQGEYLRLDSGIDILHQFAPWDIQEYGNGIKASFQDAIPEEQRELCLLACHLAADDSDVDGDALTEMDASWLAAHDWMAENHPDRLKALSDVILNTWASENKDALESPYFMGDVIDEVMDRLIENL